MLSLFCCVIIQITHIYNNNIFIFKCFKLCMLRKDCFTKSRTLLCVMTSVFLVSVTIKVFMCEQVVSAEQPQPSDRF